jgi:uncharacterized protein (TIGR02284 family)
MFNDDNNHDVDTLNELVSVTIDSADGYREAAKDAKNERFQSMFSARASERETVVRDLQAQVRTLGGTPEDDGSILAGAHRMFMNLRDTVTGGNDDSLIAEVERGEDHIKAKFETAMADAKLSTETRAVIERCYAPVRAGHDQMRDLKHGTTSANAM